MFLVSKAHYLLLPLLLTLGCAASSNRQIANLQQDLARERELIRELRSDMQRMLAQLDLLVDMTRVAPLTESENALAQQATKTHRKTCVRRGSDTSFECHRDFVDYIFNNAEEVSRGARIIPSIQGRNLSGFKLNFVKADSAIAALGLQSGDVIHSVNGQSFQLGNLVLLRAKFRHEKKFTLALTRRARPLTMHYLVTP